MTRERLVPLIVAVALFMENMDSTVIATSLPAIAIDIGTDPLALKLAVTSYLLALAIFIPGSGWTADRFGARTVFRLAIAVFIIGSIGCALSDSLHSFVIARFVQGMGGAMMAPVGRLVLMRSVDKRNLVDAMTWVTMPALIGPLLGPPLGGFITTYFSWHWIFIINVPIGLAGIALATKYIENIRGETREPFDPIGMVLAGLGIGGLAFGLTAVGLKNFLAAPDAAGGIPQDTVSIRHDHLRDRGGRHEHEDRDPDPAAPLRLSQRADLERAGELRLHRGLRAFHSLDPDRRDAGGAVRGRLLPLAAIHQRDDDRLCRGR